MASRATGGEVVHNDRRISPDRLRLILGGWSAGRGPLYGLLAGRLEAVVTAGILDDGDRLPSERQLASVLSVARGTVVRAYDELAGRGRARRSRGSGTYVVGTAGATSSRRIDRATTRFIEPTWVLDLRVARPSLMASVRNLVDRPALGEIAIDDRDAGDPAGLPALRTAIAERMTRDGVRTVPEEILVTNGGQHAAALVGMHLVGHRGRVAVESVTWPGFPDVVEHLGGRVERIPIGPGGVDLDLLAERIARVEISFIALNPHHHNPTGTRLTDRRRAALVHLVDDAGVPLVEDRVLARLAFDGIVAPPLAALGRVRQRDRLHITIDSIDKVAWPGLRVGWIRAPAPTIQQLRTLRAMTDFAPPVQTQIAALAILDDLDRIVHERIAQLQTTCHRILDALDTTLPGAVVQRPSGGIALWIELPRGTGHDFALHAAACGVNVPSGSDYGAPSDDAHIRLPLTVEEPDLATALARLAHAWTTFA